MPNCTVCDIELQPEQKTCHVCGTNVEGSISTGSLPPLPTLPPNSTAESVAPDVEMPDGAEPSGGKECPSCGRTFGSDYLDDFCPCGTELVAQSPSSVKTSGEADVTPPPPLPTPIEAASAANALSTSTQPPSGTACVVLYSETKPRQPVHYFAITKDVLLIGRQDAVRGDFPDVDLASLVDESIARKVSRRHVEVLRARNTQTFRLRPLPGNTGTQIGKELASPGQEYPLSDGTPIILGGSVWMKFEIMK